MASCQLLESQLATSALCALLERLQPHWTAKQAATLAARVKLIDCFAVDLRRLGPANFIYSDGDALFAHADRRQQKDGSASPPGLWRLSRHCEQGGLVQTAGLRASAAPGVAQDVVLFASVPHTDEDWLPMPSGQILVARQGQLISS
jgi:glutamine amidotransferase